MHSGNVCGVVKTGILESDTMGDRINDLLMTAARAPKTIDVSMLDRLSADDWTKLTERATQHRFLPYLDFALSPLPQAAAHMPGDNRRRGWMIRYLSIFRECSLIHQILTRNGIPHLFLKGVPLALGCYPKPMLRPVRDIDILVRPADLPRAFELLQAEGGTIDHFAHKGDGLDTTAKHCTPIWSPSQVIAIELHDKLVGDAGPFSDEAATNFTEAAWVHADTFPVGAQEMPCPGPDMMFLHLVVHAVYDHELNNGPLFITDLIHLLERRTLDPETVACLSRTFDIQTGVAMALSLLPPDTPQRSALAAAVGASAPLPDQTAAALLLQNTRLTTETKLAATLSEASVQARAGLVLRRLFARRETMLNRWYMARKQGRAPSSYVLLWLWYLFDRATAMRRLQSTQPDNPVLTHLLSLRRLRDGERT